MIGYNINTSPVKFIDILVLKLEMEVNHHGTMVITGYINDEDEALYLKLLSEEVWEKVEEIGKEGEVETLFWGVIADFFIEKVNDQKKMTLKVLTGSSLMDEERHLRSYQIATMQNKQIFDQIGAKYVDSGIIYSSSAQEKIEGLVLQYHETDWEFLKRLASRSHHFLVPESKSKGTRLFYGLPKGNEFSFPENIKYSLGKNLREYRNRKHRGLSEITETDFLYYLLKQCRELHSIGDYVCVQEKKYYIYKICGSYVNGEMLFDYYLKPENGLQVLEILLEEMTGCSLDAVVTDVKEDKVQVNILEDENQSQIRDIWYPYATVYSSPDGTGWYCMPEPGDVVRITIPGKKEKDAFVTSSVHVDIDSADRKNPEYKVFKSKYKKEVRFTPNSIVITNNQGTRIELIDTEGIHIISAHSVMLEAAEDMTISSDAGSLIVAGSSSVNLRQKETSICLEDGISFTGGELRVQ